MAPELFRSEGGISRIMRLYLQALCELAEPLDEIDYIALLDSKNDSARAGDHATGRLGRRVGCGRSKLRFIWSVFNRGIVADRLICAHLHHLPIAWVLSLMRPRLRYYLVAHGIEVWRSYTVLEKWAMRRAHRILCVSEYTRRQMLRFDPRLDPERLIIVPNTFDPAFAGGETRKLFVKSYALSGAPAAATGFRGQMSDDGHQLSGSDPNNDQPTTNNPTASSPRLLCVSRLTVADRYKGIDTMIEAMPAIRREFPEATLRIVGGGDDLPRLQALAASLGLAPAVPLSVEGSQLSGADTNNSQPTTSNHNGCAVVFTGIVDDRALRTEYAACDIFALPSRKEGFGLVYLEAMTYGKPCIAARAGGAPEVVTDEVGAIVEYGNTDQIALAVADLVRHPRDPAAMERRAADYSFPRFKERLAGSLLQGFPSSDVDQDPDSDNVTGDRT